MVTLNWTFNSKGDHLTIFNVVMKHKLWRIKNVMKHKIWQSQSFDETQIVMKHKLWWNTYCDKTHDVMKIKEIILFSN